MCHVTAKDEKPISGPNLFGIVGSPAARGDGFAFSPSLRKSGAVWTVEQLDQFLANPQAVIPNNRMAFDGLQDGAQRQAILGYLETLK